MTDPAYEEQEGWKAGVADHIENRRISGRDIRQQHCETRGWVIRSKSNLNLCGSIECPSCLYHEEKLNHDKETTRQDDRDAVISDKKEYNNGSEEPGNPGLNSQSFEITLDRDWFSEGEYIPGKDYSSKEDEQETT